MLSLSTMVGGGCLAEDGDDAQWRKGGWVPDGEQGVPGVDPDLEPEAEEGSTSDDDDDDGEVGGLCEDDLGTLAEQCAGGQGPLPCVGGVDEGDGTCTVHYCDYETGDLHVCFGDYVPVGDYPVCTHPPLSECKTVKV